ncbi:phage regulatory protein/antirepressor Ant [Hansschlegelia sp.]|uniref:phage regulatory protein/antirepressor Ant n=1 Tax=Hansschlegelia sp. TaxID=2041892 RepID=UPI002C4772E7|nr:phage regulatory protein/antirepressor Ant [Hansschlegelia sp.]HVI30421.1 phage regulatory protein/antirepressor Ant [Hansschlegelia sp.]
MDLTTLGSPAGAGRSSLTMSSREIADLVETRHNQIVETIERLFEKEVLRESRKTTRTYRPEGGGRPTEIYDLTKRDTLVVVSGYDDALRAKIIDRWMELEAREAAPADPMAVLNDPAAMRGLLLTYSEKVLTLEGRVADMAPAVEALDRIAKADGSLCITDAAKALQVRPKDLFSYLREHGWIYRRPGSSHDLGYQTKVATGLLEHKVTTVLRADGSEKVTEQVRITPKGLAALGKLMPPPASAVAA